MSLSLFLSLGVDGVWATGAGETCGACLLVFLGVFLCLFFVVVGGGFPGLPHPFLGVVGHVCFYFVSFCATVARVDKANAGAMHETLLHASGRLFLW